MDDCPACDTPLDGCGGPDAACCADCGHRNCWPPAPAFDGQCPGRHPVTMERCAYTVHDRAPEYHSWVRLVHS
jgi:hypothetical protein